jgi:response regulator RpfG family c-di-GMP phosphodiesterase
MPEMSGNEVLSRVRKLYPDCVRILLSAHQDPGALIRAINEGAIFRYLSKPVSSLKLQRTLREAFVEYRIRQRGFRVVETGADQKDRSA